MSRPSLRDEITRCHTRVDELTKRTATQFGDLLKQIQSIGYALNALQILTKPLQPKAPPGNGNPLAKGATKELDGPRPREDGKRRRIAVNDPTGIKEFLRRSS